VTKPEGNRLLGRYIYIWMEDSIKMCLQEIGEGGMDWTDLTQDMEK